MITDCMEIFKPPEELCPETVLSLEPEKEHVLSLSKGWHKTCSVSQSVSQSALTTLKNLFFFLSLSLSLLAGCVTTKPYEIESETRLERIRSWVLRIFTNS